MKTVELSMLPTSKKLGDLSKRLTSYRSALGRDPSDYYITPDQQSVIEKAREKYNKNTDVKCNEVVFQGQALRVFKG